MASYVMFCSKENGLWRKKLGLFKRLLKYLPIIKARLASQTFGHKCKTNWATRVPDSSAVTSGMFLVLQS